MLDCYELGITQVLTGHGYLHTHADATTNNMAERFFHMGQDNAREFMKQAKEMTI
mgnify:CR=1 FL=1